MMELAVGLVLLLAAAIVFAARRAKRRRNFNPDDIYPHW
jgi:hypothetical protein